MEGHDFFVLFENDVVDLGELECVGQGETDEACADYDDSQGSLRRLVLLRHFCCGHWV
jgi:hypothetical protein